MKTFGGGAEDRVDFRGGGREGEGDKSSPTEYKRGNIKLTANLLPMEMGADQLNYIVTKPKTPEPHNPPSSVPPPPRPPPPPQR